MKVMISQPMQGISDEEARRVREIAAKSLEKAGYEVAEPWFAEDLSARANPGKYGIYYLVLSLLKMSECGAVYFCKGWEKDSDCKIKHEVAKKYNLILMYDDTLN